MSLSTIQGLNMHLKPSFYLNYHKAMSQAKGSVFIIISCNNVFLKADIQFHSPPLSTILTPFFL